MTSMKATETPMQDMDRWLLDLISTLRLLQIPFELGEVGDSEQMLSVIRLTVESLECARTRLGDMQRAC